MLTTIHRFLMIDMFASLMQRSPLVNMILLLCACILSGTFHTPNDCSSLATPFGVPAVAFCDKIHLPSWKPAGNLLTTTSAAQHHSVWLSRLTARCNPIRDYSSTHRNPHVNLSSHRHWLVRSHAEQHNCVDGRERLQTFVQVSASVVLSSSCPTARPDRSPSAKQPNALHPCSAKLQSRILIGRCVHACAAQQDRAHMKEHQRHRTGTYCASRMPRPRCCTTLLEQCAKCRPRPLPSHHHLPCWQGTEGMPPGDRRH